MNPRLLIALTATAFLLTACDISGLLADPRVAQREAEGKAIGGACRYALRGIEECYQLNPKTPKTAIFDGWREMDVYMRENKIEGQATPENKEGIVSADSKPAGNDKPDTPASAARTTSR